jgi:hypothetical protein
MISQRKAYSALSARDHADDQTSSMAITRVTKANAQMAQKHLKGLVAELAELDLEAPEVAEELRQKAQALLGLKTT